MKQIPLILLILITISVAGWIYPWNVLGATIPFYINPGATNSESQNPISPLANFTVVAGNNVTWINKDSSPHMLVSGTPEKGPDNIFYGDFFGTNENYTVLFEKPGVYPYYDPAWSHIRGVITVENPQVSPDFGTSTDNSNVDGVDGNLSPNSISINPGAINSDSQNPMSSANITVSAGTNVTWINKDSSPHMLVSGTPEKGPDNIFYGDFFGTNENYTVLFEKPGVYPYYDPAWSHIRGVITVENPQVSPDFGTSTDNSNVDGVDGNIVNTPNTSDNSGSNSTNIDTSESGFVSFPSFLSSSPFSSSVASPSSTFPSFTTGNTSDKSSPLTLSPLTSDQSLANIVNKVGPLLGYLFKGNNTYSSTSPSTSFPPLDKFFGTNADDTLNQSSTLSPSTYQSSKSGQTLANIVNKVGPLLGHLFNGNNTSSIASFPFSSSSQSNVSLRDGEMDTFDRSNHGTNDNSVFDNNASSSLINNISTTQPGSNSSLDEKRLEVQHALIKDLKRAYSIEAKIPVLNDFQAKGQNATIFVKVSIINPADRQANASDFKFRIDYERADGRGSGWSFINANDAGRFIVLPASNYNITMAQSQSEDQVKDSLLKSYSTFYSKGCSGSIGNVEIRDCIIIKKFSNSTGSPL